MKQCDLFDAPTRDQVAHVTKRDASGKRREAARTGAVWVLYPRLIWYCDATVCWGRLALLT